MASDLKMEIFAYNIFHDIWLKIGVRNTPMSILQIYGDECMKDNTYTEACDKIFKKVIDCRWFLFSPTYWEKIDFIYAKEMKSLSEYFDYVTRLCDREDIFGHLTVFEKLYATCTFVLYLSARIYPYCSLDIVEYSHIAWAMYFDKFSDQFYKAGGWIELKRVAKPYDFLYDLIHSFKEEMYLSVLKEASINYHKFKNVAKYVNCKNMHKGKIHVSVLWIKFQIEQFEERVVVFSKEFDAVSNMELLLKDLKTIFNFSSECESDNAKLLEDRLHERHISRNLSESFCNKIPNNLDSLETQQEDEILASSDKLVNHEIMNKTVNFGCRKDFTKLGMPGKKRDVNVGEYSQRACNYIHDMTKCPRFETDIEDSTKVDLDIDYDFKNISFDSEGEKGVYDISSPGNFKGLTDEAMNTKDIFLTNQKEEYELHAQMSPNNLPNPKEFRSEDENIKSRDESGSSCHSLKSNFCSKYKKTCHQNDSSNVKEMSATKSENNAIPKTPSASQDFPTCNKVRERSEVRVNANMELDKLRNEQDDPGICSFLRMILVLGDKQGIQQVRFTFRKKGKNKKKRKKKSKNKEIVDLKT